MTFPEPAPPQTIGTAPVDANSLNQQSGYILKQFTSIKTQVGSWREWLLTVDLTKAPYYYTIEQETLVKSAFIDLDNALDPINMTFIIRITGPF